MEISAKRGTSDPFFSQLMIAQAINRLHGGAVVSAWDRAMIASKFGSSPPSLNESGVTLTMPINFMC